MLILLVAYNGSFCWSGEILGMSIPIVILMRYPVPTVLILCWDFYFYLFILFFFKKTIAEFHFI